MLIAGASGHAVETLGILEQTGYSGRICFYDDVNINLPDLLFDIHSILKTPKEARVWFEMNSSFCLGVGNPHGRKALASKLSSAGGTMVSLVSPYSYIGKHNVILGKGITIMTGAVITENAHIGEGTLIHIQSSIHHNVVIGSYCELSPGCRVLGGVSIGNDVSVGAGAIILPRIVIGNGATIGAGAVVTKSVPSGAKVAGVPARILE